jgi:hypothetical protein
MKDRELPSYGSPVTREYEVSKRPTRYPPDDLKKWLTEDDLKKETKY